MRQHLKQKADKTQGDRNAVAIIDGVAWHTDDIAGGLDNLWIIKLIAYSQELKPIEQDWLGLGKRQLA